MDYFFLLKVSFVKQMASTAKNINSLQNDIGKQVPFEKQYSKMDSTSASTGENCQTIPSASVKTIQFREKLQTSVQKEEE